jgi:predicted phage terminase large subunit-like protein
MQITKKQLDNYIAIRRAIEAKTSTFEDWLKDVSPTLNWELKYLVYIRRYLDRIIDGEKLKIMCFLPPQHGKSTQNTIHFPAFYLYKYPDHRIMLGCHTQEFANKFSRQIRAIAENYVELSKHRKAVGEWETRLFGGLNAGGVGIGTGLVANLILIDDPIKKAEQLASKAYRDWVWEWWTTSIESRISTETSIVFTMTRHHQDDLAGRILDREGDEWIIINIPAICDDPEHDLLGRKENEVLWPRKFPYDLLKKKEKTMGAGKFAALYQQRPTAQEGGTFKREWIHLFTVNPNPKMILLSIDGAFKDSERNDYSVVQVWYVTATEYHLIYNWRKRCLYPELKKSIINIASKYKPHQILIEDKASGEALIPELKSSTRLPIKAIKPKGSKEVRAAMVTGLWESGKVKIKQDEWTHDFIEEVASFPNAVHDDQVDAMTQLLVYMIENTGSSPIFIGC